MFSNLNRFTLPALVGTALIIMGPGCRSSRAPQPYAELEGAEQPVAEAQPEAQPDEQMFEQPVPPPPPDASDNLGGGILAWDAIFKEYRARPGETNAPFNFALTNISAETLTIYTTESTCDCAVGKLPATPWLLSPGDNGQIQANVDLRNKSGSTTNWMIVFTSKGNRLLSLKTVTPRRTQTLAPALSHPMGERENLTALEKAADQ